MPTTKIFTETKKTELSKDGNVYVTPFFNKKTGTLHFRVDWSLVPIPGSSLNIEVQINTENLYDFIIMTTTGIIYNPDSITTSSIKSARFKFIPFILRKKMSAPSVACLFNVLLIDRDTNNTIQTSSVSLLDETQVIYL